MQLNSLLLHITAFAHACNVSLQTKKKKEAAKSVEKQFSYPLFILLS